MIDIKIDEDIVYVDVKKDGRHFKKITDLETFRETVGIVETSYDSGWLPGKTGVKRIIKNAINEKVVYIHPGGRKTVRYTQGWYPNYNDEHGYTEEDYASVGYSKDDNMDDDDYKNYIRSYWKVDLDRLYEEGKFPQNQLYEIMIPDAIIIASKTTEAKYWAVRLFTLGFNTLLTGREQLYEYPMPNIYSGSGRICWGSDSDEFDTSFEGIQPFQGLLPKFLSSPFNRDLSDGRIEGDTSLINFWKEMDTMFKEGATNEEVYSLYERKFRSANCTVDTFI